MFDGPSRVIDLGRQRLFTGALRRAIEARDRFCTGPGCDVPAADCDIHHREPHSQGGRTDQTNGDPECDFHHPWLHQHDAKHKIKNKTKAKPPPSWPRPRPASRRVASSPA